MANNQVNFFSSSIPIIPKIVPVIVNITSRVDNRTRSYARALFDNFCDPYSYFRTQTFLSPYQRCRIVAASIGTAGAITCGMALVVKGAAPHCSQETLGIIKSLFLIVTPIVSFIGAGVYFQLVNAIYLTQHERVLMDIELGQEDHAD